MAREAADRVEPTREASDMDPTQRDSAPTAPGERLAALDLVRGFSLLGILVINVRYFAMPMAGGGLNNPNLPGGHFGAADFWTWFGANVLFEDKMMALFSMLFGAGLWLMRDRGLFLHYRRMFWLLLIGLVHASLLWFGDILTLYALCGMVVVWFRRLPASLLIVLGLSSVLFSIGQRPAERMWAQSTHVESAAQPTAEAPSFLDDLRTRRGAAMGEHFAADTEAAMHRGSWMDQTAWRVSLLPWWQGAGFLFGGLWWNGGLMLLGMGLMGLGFLTGTARASTYLSVGFTAMALGVALSVMGVWPQTLAPLGREAALWARGDGPMPEALTRHYQTARTLRQLGTPLVSLGWCSLLLWLHRSGVLRRLLHPFVAVGRMALSNYLTHTLICVVVFEGWGFGQWNEVRVLDQMRLIGVILAAQLVLCPLWLLVFRFGPAEWLWRSLSYGRRQPFLRRWREPPAPSAPAPPEVLPPSAGSPSPDTPGPAPSAGAPVDAGSAPDTPPSAPDELAPT